MGNMHLVTGYAGKEHVTAADQGAFNSALIGTGRFALNKGNGLAAQVISNNQIRVLDGELMVQGRFVRLDPGTYVDLKIDSGTQGTIRNDLIVARYTKDAVTGIEDCNLVVLKGTAVASNPADPAHTEGDIMNDGSLQADMPLYRVRLNGINIQAVEPLFTMKDTSIPFLENAKQDKTDTLTAETALADGDYLPFFDVSAGSNRKVLWSRIKTVLGNVFAPKDHSHELSALGAAASSHKHGASDINSGILSVARGGTGVSDLEALVKNMRISKVQHGSYVGTGTAGKDSPNVLTFDFVPKLLVIEEETRVGMNFSGSSNASNWIVLVNGVTSAIVRQGINNVSNSDLSVTWTGNTVSFCHTYSTPDASSQLNKDGTTYHYVAIG